MGRIAALKGAKTAGNFKTVREVPFSNASSCKELKKRLRTFDLNQ